MYIPYLLNIIYLFKHFGCANALLLCGDFSLVLRQGFSLIVVCMGFITVVSLIVERGLFGCMGSVGCGSWA